MRLITCMLFFCCLGISQAAANGYDTYCAPIAWSPDSSMLCTVIGHDWPQAQVASEGVVLIYDQYGRIQFDLGVSDAGSPAFSPDGKYLAYISNGQIAVHETEGFEQENLIDLEGSALDLSFVGPADNYELAYSTGPRFYGATLVRQPLQGGDWAEFPKPLAGDSALSLRLHNGTGDWAFMLQSTAEDSAAYERIFSFDDTGEPYQLTKPQLREWDYHESNIKIGRASCRERV